MHPMAINEVLKPAYYLDDFVRVGMINLTSAEMLQDGNALNERFHKIQENLIASDLSNCSKTAWMLPNYLAQISHRRLKKSEKHSDVSGKSYTSPDINFWYIGAYITSSILQQISRIPNSGLLEWWPKLINRSDLILGPANAIPTKPNMTRNILVIFIFLFGGLSIALLCMIFELWRSMLREVKIGCTFVLTKLRLLSNKCKSVTLCYGDMFVVVKSNHT